MQCALTSYAASTIHWAKYHRIKKIGVAYSIPQLCCVTNIASPQWPIWAIPLLLICVLPCPDHTASPVEGSSLIQYCSTWLLVHSQKSYAIFVPPSSLERHALSISVLRRPILPQGHTACTSAMSIVEAGFGFMVAYPTHCSHPV